MIDDSAVIRGNVQIENGASIGCYCVIENQDERPLVIRSGSVIKNFCEITGYSVLGENLFLGSYSFIRSGAVIGRNTHIGSRCEVHADCSIGDFVRMQGYNNLGSGTSIGNLAWIFPGCTFTNDKMPPSGVISPSKVGDFAVVMASCLIYPGVTIGKESVIGAGSEVKTDIRAGYFAKGRPAREFCPAKAIKDPVTMKPAYPWYERYTKGIDLEIIKKYL